MPKIMTIAEADALYERYAMSLEGDHWGQYVAIVPDGRTALGSTLVEAADLAAQQYGPGAVLFKLGMRVAGKWRLTRR